MAKVLDFDIVVSYFNLQLRYSVRFRKIMTPLTSTTYIYRLNIIILLYYYIIIRYIYYIS